MSWGSERQGKIETVGPDGNKREIGSTEETGIVRAARDFWWSTVRRMTATVG